MTVDLRQAVLRELRRQNKTVYWLGRQPGLTCTEQTISQWLNHGRNIGYAHVQAVLGILGLNVGKTTKSGAGSAA